MPRFIKKDRSVGASSPKTRFAREALQTLNELSRLGRGRYRPIEFFGPAVPTVKTRWSSRYPTGYMVHCRIEQSGLGRYQSEAGARCASESCQQPVLAARATKPLPGDCAAPSGVRI